ncbi:MAG: undecaprenyl-phosphate glucose phosphotransferase [Methylobacterium sp.]|nr:MAG: undecaprenyl-phosphate glucose phosphotransferase [Methylobacterium sp.]
MSEWNLAPKLGGSPGPAGRRPGLIERLFSARPGSDPTLAPLLFAWFASALEALLIAALGYGIAAIYVGDRPQVFAEYLLPVPLLALAAVATFQSLDLYAVPVLRRFPGALPRLLMGWTIVFLLAFALIFFLKLDGVFSRVVFGAWYASGLFALSVSRLAIVHVGQALATRGAFRRRAVLVGGGPEAEAFLAAMKQGGEHDLEIVGIVDDRTDDRSPVEVGGIRKLGDVASLAELARQAPIDLAIFTLPVTAENRILRMLGALNVLPIDIRLAAHAQRLRFKARHYSYFGNLPVFAISDRPVAGWANFQKAMFDRLLGAIILVLVSPLMLIVALAVKLDSRGPVFFRQRRFGFNNEPIEVFKFRSMYADKTDHNAAKLATRGDPRITRVGRFIRRTSLDELPQLFNVVFFGNLSLVGPRPHAFAAKAGDRLYEDVIDGYFARHRVKPGMTGWAQINGWRGETDTPDKLQKRVEHDLHYIENWSLFFDFSILVMTPVALIRGENAY